MFFSLSQNDRLPVLTTELSDSQGVVDITSGTPVLYYRLRTLASGLNSGVGTIVGNAQTGTVQYAWTNSDTINPGVYCGYWRINFSGINKSITFPNDNERMIFQISAGLE